MGHAPIAERVTANLFGYREPAFHYLLILVFLGDIFEVIQKLLNHFGFRKQVLRGEPSVELVKRVLHLLGKLLVDMPAMSKVVILADLSKWFADGEQKMDVILEPLVLREMSEEIILDDDDAQ